MADQPQSMSCAYCGTVRPWGGPEHRRWWPTLTYAQCWPCTIRWAERNRRPDPEPWWWRRLARLVRVDWRWYPWPPVFVGLRGPHLIPDPNGGPGCIVDC